METEIIDKLFLELAQFTRAAPMKFLNEHDLACHTVCAEIQEIMSVYREQEASPRGVGTPGGLEHMGDVWRLLAKWDGMLGPKQEVPTVTELSLPRHPNKELVE